MFKKLMAKNGDGYEITAVNVRTVDSLMPHPDGHAAICIDGEVTEVQGSFEALYRYMNEKAGHDDLKELGLC